jgi:hypothetical protein
MADMRRLTSIQRRALLAVERIQASDDVAHDFEGFLSMTSGNWPATARSLVRRGLIWEHHDPMRPDEEAWTYTLTPLGSDICVAIGRKATHG